MLQCTLPLICTSPSRLWYFKPSSHSQRAAVNRLSILFHFMVRYKLLVVILMGLSKTMFLCSNHWPIYVTLQFPGVLLGHANKKWRIKRPSVYGLVASTDTACRKKIITYAFVEYSVWAHGHAVMLVRNIKWYTVVRLVGWMTRPFTKHPTSASLWIFFASFCQFHPDVNLFFLMSYLIAHIS